MTDPSNEEPIRLSTYELLQALGEYGLGSENCNKLIDLLSQRIAALEEEKKAKGIEWREGEPFKELVRLSMDGDTFNVWYAEGIGPSEGAKIFLDIVAEKYSEHIQSLRAQLESKDAELLKLTFISSQLVEAQAREERLREGIEAIQEHASKPLFIAHIHADNTQLHSLCFSALSLPHDSTALQEHDRKVLAGAVRRYLAGPPGENRFKARCRILGIEKPIMGTTEPTKE